MRKLLIILVSTVVTAMNVNSYRDLSQSELDKAKLMAKGNNEIVLEKLINWSFGSTILN